VKCHWSRFLSEFLRSSLVNQNPSTALLRCAVALTRRHIIITSFFSFEVSSLTRHLVGYSVRILELFVKKQTNQNNKGIQQYNTYTKFHLKKDVKWFRSYWLGDMSIYHRRMKDIFLKGKRGARPF
jgi:hypothetical protein